MKVSAPFPLESNRLRSSMLLYCTVAGSLSLAYGSVYTVLADLRDGYGFTEAEVGCIVAAGVPFGPDRAARARAVRRPRICVTFGPWRNPPHHGGDVGMRARLRILGVARRASSARIRQWRSHAGHAPDRDRQEPGKDGRKPRPTRVVRRRRIHPRAAGRRGTRRAVRCTCPLLLLRRALPRSVRAGYPPRPGRARSRHRIAGSAPCTACTPRDPGNVVRPRGVLHDCRADRGDLGCVAARPRRRPPG